MSRRAKIVCTLGPATGVPERVRGLVQAGMDIARLNFSHGSYADHELLYALVRDAAKTTGRAVGVLADLQGPKIRLGKFSDGPIEWRAGDTVVITNEDILGTASRVSCTYRKLPVEVKPGDRLLIDDGKVAVEVTQIDDGDISCLVVEGGQVSSNKGVSLPNVAVTVPALSEKDAADLRFALHLGVDIIALSFVRSPDDVKLVHQVMDEVGIHRPVLAKVEKPEAVEALEGIIDAFDGVMVARGDLGVELPLDQVPVVQKRAVQRCRERAKPVIVATQMLDSMIENPRPTRAEASDVANAVLDGADAVMLSGETSVGRYPVLSVSTMAKIIVTTEAGSFQVPHLQHDPRTRGGAITAAANHIAEAVEARAVVAFSLTGDTVRRLSRLHSPLPLLAFTPDPAVRSQLSLSWGVQTFLVPHVEYTDAIFRQVDQVLVGLEWADIGDYIVVVAGSPPGTPGSTNMVRIHRLGSLVGPT
ncbi:MAG: pyruvate kinase [Dactylosporangium sp.]|nr:pyruvate kinase [Dactylosporangium sp.]NNJ59500.1 pyruvate kinase [Dactylosporangium sp.]